MNKIKTVKNLFITLTACCSLLFFNSCIKAEADPDKENPIAPVPSTQDFKWTPNGQAQVTADSSHYYNSFTTIFAFKTGTLSSIEINLSSLSVGTYSLSSTTGNALSYVNKNVTYNSVAGSVSITSSADNKLSGRFNCTFTGTLSGISGEFVDVHAK